MSDVWFWVIVRPLPLFWLVVLCQQNLVSIILCCVYWRKKTTWSYWKHDLWLLVWTDLVQLKAQLHTGILWFLYEVNADLKIETLSFIFFLHTGKQTMMRWLWGYPLCVISYSQGRHKEGPGEGGHWSTLARLLYVGIILINMRLESEEDTLQWVETLTVIYSCIYYFAICIVSLCTTLTISCYTPVLFWIGVLPQYF